MAYYFSKILNLSFDEAVSKVTEELKKEGFGILTDIDVQATLKKKLNVDFRKYRILGSCNPPFAYQALLKEDKIGTMLPCNVIVQEMPGGKVEVAAIDPYGIHAGGQKYRTAGHSRTGPGKIEEGGGESVKRVSRQKSGLFVLEEGLHFVHQFIDILELPVN